MKDQIISFETAKLAHEKGFNQGNYMHESRGCYVLEDCKVWRPGIPDFWEDKIKKGEHFSESPQLTEEYKDRWREVIAWSPTQSLLQKWLREEFNIMIEVEFDSVTFGYKIFNPYKSKNHFTDTKFEMWNYEEALEEGLKEALTLIKEKDDEN